MHIATFSIDDFRQWWISQIEHDEITHKDYNITHETIVDAADILKKDGIKLKITLEREYG